MPNCGVQRSARSAVGIILRVLGARPLTPGVRRTAMKFSRIRLARIGGSLLALSSIAAWQLLSRWSNAPTLHPLSVEFSTKAGEDSSYTLRINSADRYFISIACKPQGPLQGQTVASAGGEEAREIPCDLNIVLSARGHVVHQQLIGRMKPAYFTTVDGRLGFSLLDVDLNELGEYQLAIHNTRDLSFLKATDPLLKLSISDSTIKSRIVIAGIMNWVCLATGIVGAILAMFGFAVSQ